MLYSRLISVALATLLIPVGAAADSPTQSNRTTDYLRDVKPLLARECVRCHGESQHKGGLRLDTARNALTGGDHGPAVVPGNPKSSTLIQAIQGAHAEISRMPYKRQPLRAEEILTLSHWIANGAVAPSNETPSRDRHWAFDPPQRPPTPRPASPSSPAPHPIDAFIDAELAARGLQRSPEAEPPTLLRRLSLDLTGLPPTPAELEAFEQSPHPGAYERWVDRLLASPAFGERQGRVWLDLARYADSNGYSIDSPRSIWPYRDWVIAALNSNLSFRDFTLWQLAGDLLPNATLEQKVATGFHRNTPVNHEGGIDPEQFRVESIVDRVNTTATVWLGVTLGCAQCHDHKFDPFTMKEYYQLFSFFNQTENDGHGSPQLVAENTIDLASPAEIALRDKHLAEVRDQERALRDWEEKSLKPRQPDWEQSLTADQKARFTRILQEVIEIPPAKRAADQAALVYAKFRDSDPDYQNRRRDLDALRKRTPVTVTSLVMKERADPRKTPLLTKGDFTRPGEVVDAGAPNSLHPFNPRHGAAIGRPSRLDLAEWLVSPKNPLTARVIVNRLWQQHFGRGLVETENDFGTQGTPPSHPALLDWLAVEFMEHHWDLKHMHRLIVTSATYRQSARIRPEHLERDPRNQFLARQNRLRIDAENIRDSHLAASGLLDRRIGGKPVFPPQPTGLGAFTQNDREWIPSQNGDRYRRGLYTHLQRTSLHPAFAVFDAPDTVSSCTRRNRSNTPLQSLTLLNDPAYFEIATAFAQRAKSLPGDVSQRIESAFQIVATRTPSAQEHAALQSLYFEENKSSPTLHPEGPEFPGWLAVARVLLNLDETITRE